METIRAIFGYPSDHYNCSGKTKEEWMDEGERWPLLGNTLQALGIVYMFLYSTVIFAMLRLELTKNPCYKIMLCIVFADMANLVANSLFGGYFMSTGAVFCQAPVLMYLEGAYNTYVWSFVSVLYIILAVNRLVMISGSTRLARHFMRIPLLFWLLLAAIWGFYVGILHKPLTYNSRVFSAFYLPFIEDPAKEMLMYENRLHGLSNILFSIIIFILYLAISLLLIFKKDKAEKMSRKEINALLQASLITAPAMMGSLAYVYIQFSNQNTLAWAIFAQFLWQAITGMDALIYLIFNHSIRAFYFTRKPISGVSGQSYQLKRSTEAENN